MIQDQHQYPCVPPVNIVLQPKPVVQHRARTHHLHGGIQPSPVAAVVGVRALKVLG